MCDLSGRRTYLVSTGLELQFLPNGLLMELHTQKSNKKGNQKDKQRGISDLKMIEVGTPSTTPNGYRFCTTNSVSQNEYKTIQQKSAPFEFKLFDLVVENGKPSGYAVGVCCRRQE